MFDHQRVENFFGIDFHVHTPASSCYKGEKTDNEYLNILRRYRDKKIRIISITDHNSIRGYKKFIQIKESIEHRLAVLESLLEKHGELKEEIDASKADLNLFEEILILPGVEIEVKPGIHILLIFNNKSDLKVIEDLLVSAGYSDEVQGKEDADAIWNYDVLEIFKKANSLGAIIIAAHADSTKGIYNDLSGKYRSAVFSSSELNGICYNSEKTKYKIKQLLGNKDYSRTEPVALIQASDFHGGEDEVGRNVTYLKLKEVTFEQIGVSLKNPNECVSPTERPENINIIKEVLIDPKTICYEYYREEDLDRIKMIVCSLLNSGYGTLVIGVSEPDRNIIGLNPSDYDNLPINNILKTSILPTYPMYEMSINRYPFGGKEVIAVKLSSNSTNIFYPSGDSKMYVFEDGKIITATPEIISKHVENRLIDKFNAFQAKISKKMNDLALETNLLTSSSELFGKILEIENGAIKLNRLYSLYLIPTTEKSLDVRLYNGNSYGNIIYIDQRFGPRLPYANLRCSAPKTSKLDLSDMNLDSFNAPSLILAPGGGSFIVENNAEYQVINLENSGPALVLKLNSEEEINVHKLVLAWLRSCLFIWYSGMHLGDINIHKPNIFRSVVVPLTKLKNVQKQIVQIVDTIIDSENKFLDEFNVDEYAGDEYDKKTHEYNASMDYHYSQIDEIIFKLFNLSEKQIETIDAYHQIKKIYYSKRNSQNKC